MARPRSEDARRRVLAATVELVAERGIGQLSIEEVAARSGVAKTTIYRHWPGRTALILESVNAQFEHVGAPTPGRCRSDLEAFFVGVARADESGYNARVMPCLVEAANAGPGDGRCSSTSSASNATRMCCHDRRAGTAARRARPDDIDPDVIVASIVGPLVFHKLVRRRPARRRLRGPLPRRRRAGPRRGIRPGVSGRRRPDIGPRTRFGASHEAPPNTD